MKKLVLCILSLVLLYSCGKEPLVIKLTPPVEISQPTREITQEKEETPQEKETAPVATPATETPKMPEAPAVSEDVVIPDEKNLCTISVTCEKLLSKLDKVTEEKRDKVPGDGCILNSVQVEFTEGESVFDVLQRCLNEHNIPIEYKEDLIYKSIYIQSIGGISEKDCGAYSGWMYKVNGTPPTYSASEYKLKAGDVIEFYYSC